jgi:hypothetical protein
MVLKVGKLVPGWEDYWVCGGGGGGLFGSVLSCIVWVLVVGYVIYKGAKGYVNAGSDVWVWLICGVWLYG